MANQQPTYKAYTVIKRRRPGRLRLAIGAAFPHHDGTGYNLILQALPIPNGDGQCKIVLRPPKDDDTKAQEQSRKGKQK